MYYRGMKDIKILKSKVIHSLDKEFFENELNNFCKLNADSDIEIQYSPIVSSANDIMFTALVITKGRSEVDGEN